MSFKELIITINKTYRIILQIASDNHELNRCKKNNRVVYTHTYACTYQRVYKCLNAKGGDLTLEIHYSNHAFIHLFSDIIVSWQYTKCEYGQHMLYLF